MKYLLTIVLLSICCSCSDNKKQQNATNGDSTVAAVANTRQFYKRFTGTVAGQPVTVYLQRSAALLQGSYSYDKSGLPIQLINWQDSVRADDSLVVYEWPLIDRNDDSSPEWRVHLSGNKLTGIWSNSSNGKTYPIDLTENYTADNMQFDVQLISDTVRARPTYPEPYAYKSYQLLIPAAEKQQKTTFYNKIIGADLGCEGKDYTTCLKADMKPYFDDYLEGMVDFDTAESEMWQQMAYASRHYQVTYNEQGWLILHSSFNAYMGGAHGMHGSAYINMDTKSERVWELKDILTADSVQLSPLLDRSIRKAYGLSATEALNGRFFTDHVPPTDNLYIVPAGLVFVYNEYEIASYADGEINVFVPFAQLMPYLTPAFKRRMGLTK